MESQPNPSTDQAEVTESQPKGRARPQRRNLFDFLADVLIGGFARIYEPLQVFAIILFLIATVAIVIVLLRQAAPWWAQAGIVLTLLGVLLYLINRFIPKDRNESQYILVKGEVTLGDLRTQLETFTPDELEQFAARHALAPFPEERDTTTKKINYLMDSTPVAAFRTPKRTFERAAFIATAVISILATGLWVKDLVAAQSMASELKRSKAQRECVVTYFDGLNSGIDGKPEGWTQFWQSMSNARQSRQQQRWPGEYPQHFEELYRGSSFHDIKLIDRKDEGNIYTILYQVRERIPVSEIHIWFQKSRDARIEDLFSRFPDSNSIVSSVVDNVKAHYFMNSSNSQYSHLTEAQLEAAVSSHVADRLNVWHVTAPNLLVQIAAKFSLEQRVGNNALQYADFDTVYVKEFTLTEEDGRWKVDLINQKASYSHVVITNE